MAITSKTVTKESVEEKFPKCFIVTLRLICTDGPDEVINKPYTKTYEKGQSILAVKNNFVKRMQYDIDKYNREQQIYNAAALDNVVASIESELEI